MDMALLRKSCIDFVKTYEDKETDTEVMFEDLGNGECFISFYGATSKLDFKQIFKWGYTKKSPFLYKMKCHKATLKKFLSVEKYLEEKLSEKKYTKINGAFFSQGGALAEILRYWLYYKLFKGNKNSVISYKYIPFDFIIMNPYKVIVGYPLEIYCIDKDMAWRWPLWRKRSKDITIIKSPYNFFRFKKNHMYFQELIEKGINFTEKESVLED